MSSYYRWTLEKMRLGSERITKWKPFRSKPCISCVLLSAAFMFIAIIVLIFSFLRYPGISFLATDVFTVVFLILVIIAIVATLYAVRRGPRPPSGRIEQWFGQREARRMRRVPFYILKGKLSQATIETLIRKYRMRREVAQILLQREVREPEDLLRFPDLLSIATPHELWQLMRDPDTQTSFDAPEFVIRSEIKTDETSGTFIGYRTTATGRTRVFIADTNGDLISAETALNQPIEYASVRFLGYRVFQLINLDAHQIRDFLLRLHSRVAVRAGLIWKREDIQLKDFNDQVRALSQILRVLQGFTYRGAVAWRFTSGGTVAPGGGPSPPGIIPPEGAQSTQASEDQVDGCTYAPDFDFKDCCDAHDRCYNDGCTSCDRLKCDWELYECIVNKGLAKGEITQHSPQSTTLLFAAVENLTSFIVVNTTLSMSLSAVWQALRSLWQAPMLELP